jgi:hypothetical protein
MKRIVLGISALLGVLISARLCAASDFRTSLLNLKRGVFHMPFDYVANAWWFDQMDESSETKCVWNADFWAAGYERAANKSYLCHQQCIDSSDCDEPVACKSPKKTHTGGLSALLFGKDSFTVDESFADGQLTVASGIPFNPFLAVSQIRPTFDYNEKGVYFGVNVEGSFGCEGNWHVSGRFTLPFKAIEMRQDPTCLLEESISELISDQCLVCDANQTGDIRDFAYRLDLLSVLTIGGFPNSISRPLVEYGPIAGVNNPQATKIGAQVGFPVPQDAPIYITKRTNGTLPEKTILDGSTYIARGKTTSQVEGPLPADGSGENNATYHFNGLATNYEGNLAKNKAMQRTLFVVPHIRLDATGRPDTMMDNGKQVRNQILAVLDGLSSQQSALDFLCKECCIDLRRYERATGLGDLYAEMDLGYTHPERCYYGHGVLGLTLPTGNIVRDARRPFFLTTGNNNHYEMKVGLEGGWIIRSWAGLRADIFFNHVFKATEKRATPFQGATIRNIGQSVDAQVSWDYVEAELELNLFHPYNMDLGGVLGYQFYGKVKDHVQLCKQSAIDCLGRTKPLDANILRNCTDSIAHKIRGEIFHRWNYFELFVGAYHVVAGKNVMKETEAHIGVKVYF